MYLGKWSSLPASGSSAGIYLFGFKDAEIPTGGWTVIHQDPDVDVP